MDDVTFSFLSCLMNNTKNSVSFALFSFQHLDQFILQQWREYLLNQYGLLYDTHEKRKRGNNNRAWSSRTAPSQEDHWQSEESRAKRGG